MAAMASHHLAGMRFCAAVISGEEGDDTSPGRLCTTPTLCATHPTTTCLPITSTPTAEGRGVTSGAEDGRWRAGTSGARAAATPPALLRRAALHYEEQLGTKEDGVYKTTATRTDVRHAEDGDVLPTSLDNNHVAHALRRLPRLYFRTLGGRASPPPQADSVNVQWRTQHHTYSGRAPSSARG